MRIAFNWKLAKEPNNLLLILIPFIVMSHIFLYVFTYNGKTSIAVVALFYPHTYNNKIVVWKTNLF